MDLKVSSSCILFIVLLEAVIYSVTAFEIIDDDVSKPKPIIIKTPLTSYIQPNLNDYNNCMKTLENCIETCNKDEDCLAKCPKCPILVKQNIIVQGINDTTADYKALIKAPVNATNVIRITNKINNIIENNLGDIISRNENNIFIDSAKQNAACDKFGVGCDENGGTCCYIISNHRKQKYCGTHCLSRVMLAKSIVQCEDETKLDSCKKLIEYKPYRPKSRTNPLSRSLCSYQESWPFVSCAAKADHSVCSAMCLELPYSYVLQHGVPSACTSCYKSFHISESSDPPLEVVPKDNDNNIPQEDELNSKDWILEKEKCRLADGTISENCETSEKHTNDNEIGSGFDGISEFIDPSLESFIALDSSGKSRNTFRRSKYSLRNKQTESSSN